MLKTAKALKAFSLRATDGQIGTVDDFYFDDISWTVRYLIIKTGTWLTGRKVLIAPAEVREPDWANKTFPVSLTKDQVEHSPAIETEKPISRQQEVDLHAYYDWPVYWSPTGLVMGSAPPIGGPTRGPGRAGRTDLPETVRNDLEVATQAHPGPDLRSVNEVAGYGIQALDGELGHVEDFLIEAESWMIRYLIVDTRNWLPGQKVLIARPWITRVDWPNQSVYVDLTVEAIKNSPEYDPGSPVTRAYEEELFGYYDSPSYWP